MTRLLRNASSLLLAGVLTAPVAMYARPDDRDHDKDHRVYDPYRHDYHNWNGDEDRAYRDWYTRTYNGRAYRDYGKLKKKDQRLIGRIAMIMIAIMTIITEYPGAPGAGARRTSIRLCDY